jgi:threonine synthase
VRILELFHQQLGDLKKALGSCSVSDEQTKNTLRQVYQQHQYLTDPHGAVGYYALQQYLVQHPGQKGIFLETAHPVKFYDVVEPVINEKVPVPDVVKQILDLPQRSIRMEAEYEQLKQYLLSH